MAQGAVLGNADLFAAVVTSLGLEDLWATCRVSKDWHTCAKRALIAAVRAEAEASLLRPSTPRNYLAWYLAGMMEVYARSPKHPVGFDATRASSLTLTEVQQTKQAIATYEGHLPVALLEACDDRRVLQMATAFDMLHANGVRGSILVVTHPRRLSTWAVTLQELQPSMQVVRVEGPRAVRRDMLRTVPTIRPPSPRIVVASHTTLADDLRRAQKTIYWDMVVWDELLHRIVRDGVFPLLRTLAKAHSPNVLLTSAPRVSDHAALGLARLFFLRGQPYRMGRDHTVESVVHDLSATLPRPPVRRLVEEVWGAHAQRVLDAVFRPLSL